MDVTEFYDPDEWEDGLRCLDCGTEFVTGQPISERLIEVDRLAWLDDEPVFTTEIVCVSCAIGGAT